MPYTAQLHTAAGLLLVGPFDTIEAARIYAPRAPIIELLPPDTPADTLTAATLAQLAQIINNEPHTKNRAPVLDEPPTHPVRSTQAHTAPNTHKEKPVNTAQEYADTIAAEIRALETALDGPGRSWDPENPAEDDDQDAEYRAALTALEYAYDIDPADIFATYVNETVLEVIHWNSTTEETRTEWLRTYGGPGCRIYFETGQNYAEVVSTWAGDNTARVEVYVPTLASQVNEIAETATR